MELFMLDLQFKITAKLTYNLAYKRRSYKGAGAYIRIKAPWRLYPAQYFEYRISYRILTKK